MRLDTRPHPPGFPRIRREIPDALDGRAEFRRERDRAGFRL
jgi:hypothetical protein